jgi:hypothetical protein
MVRRSFEIFDPVFMFRNAICFTHLFFNLTPGCRMKTAIETTNTFFPSHADTAWIGQTFAYAR